MFHGTSEINITYPNGANRFISRLALSHVESIFITLLQAQVERSMGFLLAVYQHDNGRIVGMDIFYWPIHPNLPCLWF